MSRTLRSLTGFLLIVGICGWAGSAEESKASVRSVDSLPLEGGNAHYVGNRPPLTPSALMKLPIRSIKPRGWLLHQLQLMADGMVGRLPELSGFCRDDSGWLTLNTRGWEEAPYWLKGFGDLGYILGDERIIAETRRWLESALASQQLDGYFGPPQNKANHDLWPNMIVLFCLQSYYDYSGDERIPPFMARYFRYQKSMPREQLLPRSWQNWRGGDNLESVYWLYNRTGDAELLAIADIIFERTANWTEGFPTWHGVNITMGIRQPGVYWQQSKDNRHLEAVERNYRTVMGEYGQVPGGMFAADENCRKGHAGAQQAAETCSIIEFMYSNESLLKITGDPKYADRCEEIAFNSLPAAIMPDWRGLHYLTAPNQTWLDKGDAHVYQNQGTMVSYSPWIYRCCQHNVAQGWPYYVEHLWMATQDNGLAAVLYAPCTVTAKVGAGAVVTIHENTRYPFGEEVEFVIECGEPVRFPLALRVPAWCEGAMVAINDVGQSVKGLPRGYLVIEREWKGGDRLRLEMPMRITLRAWEKQANAVSVDRGPLTYSLKIGEDWKRYGTSDTWPEYEVFPTTPWNYGLIVDRENPAASFEVVEHSWLPYQPWEANAAPVLLRARGRRIPNWTLVNHCTGPLQPSPVKSDEPVEEITLIPMGCAHLRIAVFPTIGDGPDAREWEKAGE